MYITGDTIIKLASFMAAVAALGGGAAWLIRFVDRQKAQDKELQETRAENTLIIYGVLACLKGLKEQGCDGPVTEALNKLEKHLNEAAHRGGKTL
jgi:Na+/H+ antiporter NhaD/arsenite permease-like protein